MLDRLISLSGGCRAVRLEARPRFITFDCYGTLIDWESGSKQFFRKLLEQYSAHIPLDEFHARWNGIEFDLVKGSYRPYRQILAHSLRLALSSYSLPSSQEWEEAFASSIHSWPPFPDVPPNLSVIKGPYKIAIISNIDDDIIADSIKLMGVEFDEVVTAQQAKAYKPDPKVFAYAMGRLRAKPSDLLHVAFGFDYDIYPAKELGIKTVWLNRKRERPGGPTDYVVNDMAELAELLL